MYAVTYDRAMQPWRRSKGKFVPCVISIIWASARNRFPVATQPGGSMFKQPRELYEKEEPKDGRAAQAVHSWNQ